MKTFEFPYYISYGKNDSVGCTVSIELSNKDAIRLERAAKKGGRFRLSEDEDIGDVYEKVYDAIISEDPSLDEFYIGINYPKEFQLLEKAAKDRVRQTVCDTIILDRNQVDDFLNNNSEKIIRVDDGDTLFYIPKNYQGKIVVEGVKRIDKDAFKMHKKITEIEIREGVSEIADWTFESCEKLNKVSSTGSVKRIGFNAFTKCYSLESVKLSEGIEEIDYTAFRFCEELRELTIPSTVKSISATICLYNNGLRDFFFEGENTVITDTFSTDALRSGVTLHAKESSKVAEYARANGVKFEAVKK